MTLRILDGKVDFAISEIEILEDTDDPLIPNKLIYCFREIEENRWTDKLNKKDISYNLTPLSHDQSILDKAENTSYQNKQEALDHLFSDIEPESLKQQRLAAENNQLKKDNGVLGKQIVDLELRLMRGGL